MYWEELRARPREGTFRYAVLDFDGTLSLIREGWQKIMIDLFAEELSYTPAGKAAERAALRDGAGDDFSTHGQADHLPVHRPCGGARPHGRDAMDPQAYKDEYVRRLLNTIDGRLKGLGDGTVAPETLTVPGTFALLDGLKARGVRLYLASGTDEEHVLNEARLLGLSPYFGAHIYGAQRDYKTFSKKMVIQRLIADNRLAGAELLGFGDGYVEIENVREVGGYAVGDAADEARRTGIDAWKRERLIRAGADAVIPDYREPETLWARLFGDETKGAHDHAI
jgi:phosphoglycolate phosphatase-like HAD superfamily hydrolase